MPSSAARATPTSAGYTQTAATDGISGRDGSGQTAFAHRCRTLPGVSEPSSVVRSIIEVASRMPWRLAVVLIDRRPSAAARSSTPIRLTGISVRLMSSSLVLEPQQMRVPTVERHVQPLAGRRRSGRRSAGRCTAAPGTSTQALRGRVAEVDDHEVAVERPGQEVPARVGCPASRRRPPAASRRPRPRPAARRTRAGPRRPARPARARGRPGSSCAARRTGRRGRAGRPARSTSRPPPPGRAGRRRWPRAARRGSR